MTTFPSVTGRRLIRALGKLGFEIIRVKGSQHFLQHSDGRCTVVPIHRGEIIGRGLLAQIYEIAISQKKKYKKNYKQASACSELGSLDTESGTLSDIISS